LGATFIAPEDRHHLIKRRVLTEFRQLQRFGRLLKWPADQPLLANHIKYYPIDTFTGPLFLRNKIGFDFSTILPKTLNLAFVDS